MITVRRFGRGSVLVLVGFSLAGFLVPAAAGGGQSTPAAGTPATPDRCAVSPAGGGMGEMGAATPAAGEDLARGEAEFDQLYIDMMMPHHASIIAMAEAALPRLENERLREIAQAVVATQRPEIERLRGLRERFYGSAEPIPLGEMDAGMMGAMERMAPGTGTMAEMMFQMDPAAQVAAICGAADADRVFIDLTIPHHEMAIVASESALAQAVHPEIVEFARRVIVAQRLEIETLTTVREELYGSATPEPVAAGNGSEAAADHEAMLGGVAANNDGALQALPPAVVAQIERGEGAGLALPAEANGVPGPRHALDLAEELELTAGQRRELEGVFEKMQAAALPLGERFLAAERALEADFRTGTVAAADLPRRVAAVSRLEGELATVHLAAHLETAAILTPEQTARYLRLRGA